VGAGKLGSGDAEEREGAARLEVHAEDRRVLAGVGDEAPAVAFGRGGKTFAPTLVLPQ
jgi:hypothetical protein